MIKMKCIRCKHDNKEGSSHCYYCGYKIIYDENDPNNPELHKNDIKDEENSNDKYQVLLFIPLTLVYFIAMLGTLFLFSIILGEGILIMAWACSFLLLPISAILAYNKLFPKNKNNHKKEK